MKLIEAMKEIKALKLKADDLVGKIGRYSARASFETNTYPDQMGQVKEWLQSHHDTIKRIAKISVAIQKTNLQTDVEIDIDGKKVKHSIAEWILRRRELAGFEQNAWQQLTDKGIKEGFGQQSDGSKIEIKIVRFYDPIERDNKIEGYRQEPGLIDRTLETVNAVTELVEAV